MYYSSGNYEAFARPQKPQGVDEKSAYLIGSGLAALAAACYLVRDGQMAGERIHILEKDPIPGGACDGYQYTDIGYVMRGGREMDNHFECMWDLFRSIPSIETEGVSVLDEYYWLNKADPNYSLCRATEKQGQDAHTDKKFGLSDKAAMEIMKLFFTPDEELYNKRIDEIFDHEVLDSNFWLYWRTMFAFENWHSALEMKLYLKRFIHHVGGLPDFTALRFTRYNQYESMILPMVHYLLQLMHHREDHGLILIVSRVAQSRIMGQAGDMLDVALDIELHLQRAVPVFKGEHRAPVEPEVGRENLVVEEIGDALILKLLIGRKEQAHDLHRALVADGELAVGMRVLAAVHGRAAEGRIRVFLVEPVVFVQHALTHMLEGRDIVQQIPHDLEMVVHLTAAAHHIADVHLAAVARAARNRVFFKDVDVLTLHLAVAHEVAGRGQRRKTGADDIRGLAVHAFRLLGMRERFIIAAAVIHNRNLLMIQAVPPGAFCPSGFCVPRISF